MPPRNKKRRRAHQTAHKIDKSSAIIDVLLIFDLLATELCSADATFRITSRQPPRERTDSSPSVLHYVKEGEPVRLSCTSSGKFNLCRWGRPGGGPGQQHHVACGIFGSDREKRCARGDDGAMSRWRVVRQDERTCAVEVEAAAAEEAGEWNCEMQSYPDKDGEYQSAQEYTHIVRSSYYN